MDATAVQAVIAAVLPILIMLLKQAHWPSRANALVAVVVYAVAGTLAVIGQGEAITLDSLAPSITLFATIGTVAYTAFWRSWGDHEITAATTVLAPK